LPDHLDAALRAGQAPTITIIRRSALDSDAAMVVPNVGPALQDVAGQSVASIAEEVEPAATVGGLGAAERLGMLGILASLSVLLLTIVGTMIVPSLLNEEVDRKTLAALLLVARPGQSWQAKDSPACCTSRSWCQ
jgi:hypothetical protein